MSGAPAAAGLVERLNGSDRADRLRAAAEVGAAIRSGAVRRTATEELNNHVHTIYSFSPYAPAMAAYRAFEAGLLAVGIMDHDSVAGCAEMLDAAREIGIASTEGFELRVNMTGTAVEGRKINNPDSSNIAYMAFHGIPRRNLAAAAAFLTPVQRARNQRNRRMVDRLNALVGGWDLVALDFERDVLGISAAAEGGSVTERHILYALAVAVVRSVGKGLPLVSFLTDRMRLEVPPKVRAYLLDEGNPHYLYDLLGVFKSSVVERIYEQPGEEECVGVERAVAFAKSVDAIPAYAYLGDVTDSPTGDKKAEKFEDDFLEALMDEAARLGFQAVTYMPPRNTVPQLVRLQTECRRRNLMEISGVDINSSRQSFRCPELLMPEFRHLGEASWSLIAHEKLADRAPELAFFSARNPLAGRPLEERLRAYGKIGRMIDHSNPDAALDAARSVLGKEKVR